MSSLENFKRPDRGVDESPRSELMPAWKVVAYPPLFPVPDFPDFLDFLADKISNGRGETRK